MDARLQASANIIISGSNQSGKTVFTFKLIENAFCLISPPPEKIIYCYSEYQPELFSRYPDIEFHEGLPNLSEFNGNTVPILLVLDDFLSQLNENVSDLFTKYGHHRQISVVYITQNLFSKGQHARTMSLNSHYIILFRNTRDRTQIATLARQMYPHNPRYMIEAYNDAVSRHYGYLLIDLKPNSPDELRLRTNIVPDESPQIVYIPKAGRV